MSYYVNSSNEKCLKGRTGSGWNSSVNYDKVNKMSLTDLKEMSWEDVGQIFNLQKDRHETKDKNQKEQKHGIACKRTIDV